jgi:hypothetical protein
MHTEVRYQPAGQVLPSGIRRVNEGELATGGRLIAAEEVIARLEDGGAT